MKLLILALLLSTTAAFAQSHTNRFTRIAQQADGIKVSNGIDGILWEGLDCNDVIDDAKKVGVTEIEVEEQIIESLKQSTINKLENCAKKNLVQKEVSCEALKSRASKLGLSEEEINADLGFLTSFL